MSQLKSYAVALIALACCALLFAIIQPVKLSAQERSSLASPFTFVRSELPQPGALPRIVRAVHPSLRGIISWISATGAAVAMADVDLDGKSNDLVLVEPRTDGVTVMPAPGTGERYPAFSLEPKGLRYDKTMAPMGALVGDTNEDGYPDVIVYYWGRTPIVFLNDGKGTRPSAEHFQARELVPGKQVWNTSCGLISDFDGDGHQDLLFCNYFADGAAVLDAGGSGRIQMPESIGRAYNGGGKHLLRWTGDSAGNMTGFAEQKDLFPGDVGRGWTIAVGAADLDGDMLPEIYLANDVGPDRMLHNRSTPGHLQFALVEGRGGFAVPSSFVMGKDSYKGMGVDFGDVNHDGVPDIFVSNIACPFGLEESHFLWLSEPSINDFRGGVAPYRQSSEKTGLSLSGWAWDCRLADFNNDTVPEIVQAVGFLKGTTNRWPELQALGTANSTMLSNPDNWPRFVPGDDVSGSQSNCFFVKSASGKYFDLADSVGIADASVSRGIAVGDVDADGRLDFVIANQWHPSFMYRNAAPASGMFLGLKLLLPVNDTGVVRVQPGAIQSSDPSSPAVGARAAVVLPGGMTITQQIDGGSGHSGKRAQELHFGLGAVDSKTPLKVIIDWRSRDGKVRQRVLQLTPGWHTVELGRAEDRA